jgi:hypothetical protein
MIIGTKKRTKDGDKPKPTRYYSKKQEEAVAKAVGGKLTPNSGATDFGGKSDVDIANLFNIECKTKTSNSESISIKKEWLLKNKREATFDGNPYSAIAFNFGPDSNNYYIIEEYLFLELIDHLKTLDEPL